jgi:hypothetical protein
MVPAILNEEILALEDAAFLSSDPEPWLQVDEHLLHTR